MLDDYEDLEDYEPEDVDLEYADPDAMSVARPGPTKEAAAAGDINYASLGDNAGLQAYETRQRDAVEMLRAARERAMSALKPTDDKSRYLALAAGFLAPTRTGGFGESVSNALQNYLPYRQQQRQDEMGYQQALSKYDMDLAGAEYEQAMKPPTFTDIYTTDGGKQKAVIINGVPYPVGGVYKPGSTRYGPLDKVRDLAKMTPAELELWKKYGMPQGSQSLIDINLHEDKSAAKKIGELEGEDYNTLQKTAREANKSIAKYQRLGALLGEINTGKYKGTIQQFAKAMQTFGFDPASVGITDSTALTDAATAMAREMSLQLRNPAGGAGMPGALSDADRIFLESMVPGLETDPDAIPLMVEWNIRMAKRDQELAKIARDYRKANKGIIDEGLWDKFQEYADAHPLFTEEDRKAIEALGGGATEPPPTTAADPIQILNDSGFEVTPDGKIVPKKK